MKLRAGAVAGQALRGCGHLLHYAVQFALAISIVAVLALGALAWRLSQGPIEVTGLARSLERTLNPDSRARIAIGHAAIAWEGWRDGLDHSLDIRLADIAASDADGRRIGSIPRAEVSLSAARLLTLRIVPRAVEIDGARLTVLRDSDGQISLDLGDLIDPNAAMAATNGGAGSAGGFSQILNDLTEPLQNDRSGTSARWSQLQRLVLRNCVVNVVDRALRVTWSATRVALDLRRAQAGGLEGDGAVELEMAGLTARLTLAAQLSPAAGTLAGTTVLQAHLTPLNPSEIAAAVPGLHALAALDAPVALGGTLHLDSRLRIASASAEASLGTGSAAMGRGRLPFRAARLSAVLATDGHASGRLEQLDLAPTPDGPVTTHVTGHADAQRAKTGGFDATVGVDLDQVAFANLPALWPEGVGGNGTRPWIVENVVGGNAHDLHVEAALAIPPDLSDADLRSVSGGLSGSDLTVWWLRPVPPIDHGEAKLTFVDPDTIDIAVLGGRQGGIAIQRGDVRVTGIEAPHQFADIRGQIASPLADLIALLKNPKIALLDRRPVPMQNPAGQVTGTLSVTALPLESKVSLDDLKIHTTAHATDVRLGGIVAGRDLDHGTLDLDGGNDGMTVTGTASIAAIPAQLAVAMDFRAGAPTDVITKVTASGTADEKQLAAAGLDPSRIVAGPAALQVTYLSRRNGSGEISASANLERTTITLDPLGYRKRAGNGASADIVALLDHDRIAGISRLNVTGDGLLVQGSADATGSGVNMLRLQRVKIGASTDFGGEIRFPARKGDPYVVSADGPGIDISGAFRRSPETANEPNPEDRGPGTPFQARVRFGRVVTGEGLAAANVSGEIDNDGQLTRSARITGTTPGNSVFQLAIQPQGRGRRLTGSAGDAGGLLALLRVTGGIRGGALSVEGNYDDSRADHPLSGTAEIGSFSVRDAPALGKVLQAMTLYGLADAMSGPGLNFDRLIAPFRFASSVITLENARAFSSSLGLTAAGQVNLARDVADLNGTVVPAYFFNSLLGRIPLIGKLFSPEKGGGLFAATYTISGPLASPRVSVNPLATLAPGFLRDLFTDATRSTGGPSPPVNWSAPSLGNR